MGSSDRYRYTFSPNQMFRKIGMNRHFTILLFRTIGIDRLFTILLLRMMGIGTQTFRHILLFQCWIANAVAPVAYQVVLEPGIGQFS